MKARVVFESRWGSRVAVARALAGGIGPEARTLATAEVTDGALAGVALTVAGSPPR